MIACPRVKLGKVNKCPPTKRDSGAARDRQMLLPRPQALLCRETEDWSWIQAVQIVMGSMHKCCALLHIWQNSLGLYAGTEQNLNEESSETSSCSIVFTRQITMAHLMGNTDLQLFAHICLPSTAQYQQRCQGRRPSCNCIELILFGLREPSCALEPNTQGLNPAPRACMQGGAAVRLTTTGRNQIYT